MNSVWILGNLARDTVVRATRTGKNVASLPGHWIREWMRRSGETSASLDSRSHRRTMLPFRREMMRTSHFSERG